MAWEAKKPLTLETVEVEPPRAGEVRIKVPECRAIKLKGHKSQGIWAKNSDSEAIKVRAFGLKTRTASSLN